MDISKIKNIVSLLMKDAGKTTEYQASVAELNEAIVKDIKLFNKAREDGKITMSEIMGLFPSVVETVSKSKFILSIEDINDRIDVATAIMRYIYFDDDLLDNPDIPYLPNFIESKIENWIFDLIIPGLLKGFLKKSNK